MYGLRLSHGADGAHLPFVEMSCMRFQELVT